MRVDGLYVRSMFLCMSSACIYICVQCHNVCILLTSFAYMCAARVMCACGKEAALFRYTHQDFSSPEVQHEPNAT